MDVVMTEALRKVETGTSNIKLVSRQQELPEFVERQKQLLTVLHSLTGRLGETSLKRLVSETVGVVERHYIEAALATTAGNRSAAAKMLGLSRQSLYMKLARYDIGAD